MRRQSVKMVIMGGAIALVVIFGIDIASSGIERINGPMNGNGAVPINSLEYTDEGGNAPPVNAVPSGSHAGAGSTDTGGGTGTDSGAVQSQRIVDAQHGRKTDWDRLEAQRQEELQRQLQAAYNDRLPGVPDTRSDTGVNKLADGAAGLLQSVSSKGIRMIVSLFESVTD